VVAAVNFNACPARTAHFRIYIVCDRGQNFGATWMNLVISPF
jgi:hypothetical protein